MKILKRSIFVTALLLAAGPLAKQACAQAPAGVGIPAVTIGGGGGGEGGNWHSLDAYFGPQNALLTIFVLTGLDGVTKPALAVRQGR